MNLARPITYFSLSFIAIPIAVAILSWALGLGDIFSYIFIFGLLLGIWCLALVGYLIARWSKGMRRPEIEKPLQLKLIGKLLLVSPFIFWIGSVVLAPTGKPYDQLVPQLVTVIRALIAVIGFLFALRCFLKSENRKYALAVLILMSIAVLFSVILNFFDLVEAILELPYRLFV